MDIHVKLAKQAITNYLKNELVIEPPNDLPATFFKKSTGVFVSLHGLKHALRGCIGTFLPTQANLAQEVINNAISAAIHDPRFAPVSLDELAGLTISVDVLSAPKQITNLDQLDPKKYGVIIQSLDKQRLGLLLPDLEGIDSVEQQVSIAARKGNIDLTKDKRMLFRFTVERHS